MQLRVTLNRQQTTKQTFNFEFVGSSLCWWLVLHFDGIAQHGDLLAWSHLPSSEFRSCTTLTRCHVGIHKRPPVGSCWGKTSHACLEKEMNIEGMSLIWFLLQALFDQTPPSTFFFVHHQISGQQPNFLLCRWWWFAWRRLVGILLWILSTCNSLSRGSTFLHVLPCISFEFINFVAYETLCPPLSLCHHSLIILLCPYALLKIPYSRKVVFSDCIWDFSLTG